MTRNDCTVTREVATEYPQDSGGAIARLDPDTLLEMELSPADVVEIEGADTTAAKVWRADRQDWNTGTVRIDGFTRQNAGVDTGECIEIHTVDHKEAERLILAPAEGTDVHFGSDAAGLVERQILKRPVVAGDIVPVMPSTNHPFMDSPGEAIPLVATETCPDGVVMVTESTDVTLSEDPIAFDGEDGKPVHRPSFNRFDAGTGTELVADGNPILHLQHLDPQQLSTHDRAALVLALRQYADELAQDSAVDGESLGEAVQAEDSQLVYNPGVDEWRELKPSNTE